MGLIPAIASRKRQNRLTGHENTLKRSFFLSLKKKENMQTIKKINVAALCDKAGRRANQDNIFLSCKNVLHQAEKESHHELHGDNIPIPVEGSLLVVADGMGGMNAGEVASQLVVETMAREMKDLAGQSMNDPEQVSAMARRAIVNADNAIKQYVAAHPDVSGTGSTVVLLWLLGDKAVVAWCGDSRCYRYNPRRGLEQLSHDHSYVQQQVDQGLLRPELAFGHHQGNIITRCLSDDKEVANPDVKIIDVYRNDIFLLCSDGLCGLLPDEVTEQLIKDANGDVHKALENCWRRGSAEGWSDNVSIILAAVNGVAAMAPERKVVPLPERPSYSTVTVEIDVPQSERAEVKRNQKEVPHGLPKNEAKPKRKVWPIIVLALVVVCAVVWFALPSGKTPVRPSVQPEADKVATVGMDEEAKPANSMTTFEENDEPNTQEEEDNNDPIEEETSNHAGLMQASEVK